MTHDVDHPPGPRVIGRYVMADQIASGGMATVHLGKLVGPVGFSRVVAIKRMYPTFSRDPEFVAMFLDEARIAARIRHPNVVQTLDVVALQGELFLVMDYVEGESVARLMRASSTRTGEPPPPRVCAAIVCGVLQGLHAAHEARSESGEPLAVVHRDVSPQNVLVGADGVPRVLDFGIAKAIGRMQATTRTGQAKGKLPYMAPEQIRLGAVSPATDVYGASVVFWEMLTGKRLFDGEPAEIMEAIATAEVRPPSSAARRGQEPIPEELDRIVLQGLRREPSARPRSAREMALEIERAIRIASASEVGEWVAQNVATNLSKRAALVSALESGSDGGAPPKPAGADPELVPTRVTEPETIAHAARVPAATPTRRRLTTAALGAGLLGGAALVLAFVRPAPTTSRLVAVGGAFAGASRPLQPERAPEPLEPSPTAQPAAAASSSPIGPSTAVAGNRSKPPAAQPLPAPPIPAAADRCKPPFEIDEQGVKRIKPECVR